MKSPNLKSIGTDLEAPHAEKTPVKTAKKQTVKPVKKAEVTERATVSFLSDDVKYINAIALKHGQKRGKSMPFSEALRVVIEEHRGAKL